MPVLYLIAHTLSYKDQVERITNSNFLTTFLGRFLFEAFCISIGKDIFYFKILPLDGKHLKNTKYLGCFLIQMLTSKKGTRKVGKF